VRPRRRGREGAGGVDATASGSGRREDPVGDGRFGGAAAPVSKFLGDAKWQTGCGEGWRSGAS
jgi:hypothetical protein